MMVEATRTTSARAWQAFCRQHKDCRGTEKSAYRRLISFSINRHPEALRWKPDSDLAQNTKQMYSIGYGRP